MHRLSSNAVLVLVLLTGAGCGGSKEPAKSVDPVEESSAAHQITTVNPKDGFTVVTTESETMK